MKKKKTNGNFEEIETLTHLLKMSVKRKRKANYYDKMTYKILTLISDSLELASSASSVANNLQTISVHHLCINAIKLNEKILEGNNTPPIINIIELHVIYASKKPRQCCKRGNAL